MSDRRSIPYAVLLMAKRKELFAYVRNMKAPDKGFSSPHDSELSEVRPDVKFIKFPLH